MCDETVLSPLDSFMMLRMAKTPQSYTTPMLSNPRAKVVSAAKVAPMVNAKQHPGVTTATTPAVKHDLRKDEATSSTSSTNKPIKEDGNSTTDYLTNKSKGPNKLAGEGKKDRKQKEEEQRQAEKALRKQQKRQHSNSILQKDSELMNTKEDVVAIKLAGKYLAFVSEISEDLQTLLEYLRQHGCIAQDCTLLSLTVDRTMFLAKQEERRHRDGTIGRDVFCGSLCLHAG